MSLRRCPSCKNMIAADTIECPICGRSWRGVWAWKLTCWTVLLAVAVYFAVHYLHR